MKTKDQTLLEEAYISALQKTVNVPTDPGTKDTEILDKEKETENSTQVSVNNNTDSEESEEMWMVKSNLFSLYSNSKKIHSVVQKGMDLEPWMQQKVAVCADNLEAVMKSVAYRAAIKNINV